MTFEAEEFVYRVAGTMRDEITRHVVERVTKTQAIIYASGSEEKYDRATGHQIPRGSGYFYRSIESDSSAMRLRYAQSHRLRVLDRLQNAVIAFKHANPRHRDPEPINLLVDDWIAACLAVAEAEKEQANA